VAIAVIVFAFIPRGVKDIFLVPLLVFFFLFLFFKKITKKEAAIIVVVILFLAFFITFYNIWRNYSLMSSDNFSGQEFLSYVDEKKSNTPNNNIATLILMSFFDRIDSSAMYIYSTQVFPEKMDFLKGLSYGGLFLFTPKLLFEENEVLDRGMLSARIGITESAATIMGYSWWGEAYMNYGYFGVITIVPLIYLLLEIIFLAMIRRDNDYFFFAFAGTTIFFGAIQAINSIVFFGTVLKIFIALIIWETTYNFIMKKSEKNNGKS
jgi:hypothetical protein